MRKHFLQVSRPLTKPASVSVSKMFALTAAVGIMMLTSSWYIQVAYAQSAEQSNHANPADTSNYIYCYPVVSCIDFYFKFNRMGLHD